MQAVCRNFREKRPGFIAVTAPMISFDAGNAHKCRMPTAKVNASSTAGRTGVGEEYDRLWQGRGSHAA